MESEMAVEEASTKRGHWGGRFEFVLTIIGYSVGYGNVWRFPYLCYTSGGAAFLIPYFLILVVAGIPLFFMELIIGQYSSLGPSTVWRLCPLFKGIGIAMIVQTAMIVSYYNTLLAYVIFYLFGSMSAILPWGSCANAWNTERCSDGNRDMNMSYHEMVEPTYKTSAAEEYFTNRVLQLTEGLDNLGGVRWELFGCLLFAWFLVYICVAWGIKSIGKVVYFTALFPYVMLLVLLVRGLTLPGSMNGLAYLFIPRWSSLLNMRTWGAAGTQIFYSLGPAWGGMILFSSYNRFHNNCHRDAVITSLVTCGTSLFAGLVVFSNLGFLAHELGVPLRDLASAGPGLAFVAYPTALVKMPAAPVWSIFFFLMMLTVGIDSMFTPVEVVVTGLMEEFPRICGGRRWLVSLGTCILFFLIGIPQVTQGGIYLLVLIDWYFSTFSLLIIALLECIVVIYIYGYRNLASNVQVMLGYRPNVYFIACWFVVTPITTFVVLVLHLNSFRLARYGSYVYSDGWQALGFMMGLLPIVMIPLYMAYYSFISFRRTRPRNALVFLRQLLQPDPLWGPMEAEDRAKVGLAPLPTDRNPEEVLMTEKQAEISHA